MLEACGGELSKTDMEKLLFAFCMERGLNYYDFFPYHFGCFSHLSYQDKRVLEQQGILTNLDSFKLNSSKSYITELETEDRIYLRNFVIQTKGLRGDSLVRHIYLKYPYYASRSQIKERILTPDELAIVDASRNAEEGACLFTIGYEGLTIDAYIDKLIRHNVNAVVDVRKNPISMKYGFSKTKFSQYIQSVSIAYEHIPQLGIVSSLRKNLETTQDYTSLFEHYAKHILPQVPGHIERVHNLIDTYHRVALTCFEAKASSCHRHKITERMVASNDWKTPIFHIE